MKILPEDRPKLIGLLAAVGLVLLYLAVVVLPKFRGHPAAATVATPASDTSAAAAPASGASPVAGILPDAAAAQQSDVTASALYADTSAPPAQMPDPFTPPSGSLPVGPPGAPAPRGKNGELLIPGAPGSKAAAVPAEPPPPIELQGVVLGTTPVAVMMVGDRVLYAREGDSLGFGVVLVRIAETAVGVKFGSKSIHVDIGHAVDMNGYHSVAVSRPVDRGGLQALPPASSSLPSAVSSDGAHAPDMRAAPPPELVDPR